MHKLAKKAAKKVAKKAAKKTPKGPGHDARRAYEHLHRLRILHTQLTGEYPAQLDTLSRYAQSALSQEEAKTAADLLRAGEHLAFGSLADEAGTENVSRELKQEMREEYEHFLDRAVEHWEDQDPRPAKELRVMFKALRSEAKAAWKSKAYHRALEFARAADALAHAKSGRLRLEQPPSEDSGRLSSGKL